MTEYAYAQEDILREATGAAVVHYVHGPGIDEPLAAFSAGGQSGVYHTDALGSVIGMTDAMGIVTDHRGYEVFGVPVAVAATHGYAFTGREWELGTELYYYRARYYDPSTARFVSEDPIRLNGGDANFYAYVRNSPAAMIDPSGLKVQRCCRNIDVNPAANTSAMIVGAKHCFIKTDTHEAGMGPAKPGPLPMCPFGIPTKIRDHTGESEGAECIDVPDVDEHCVNIILRTQPKTGKWSLSNNCNTVADMIIAACKKRCNSAPARSEPSPPAPCGHCSTQ
jgi:RHS repeat-associated protein